MEVLISEELLQLGHPLLTRLESKFPSVRWRELHDDVKYAYARCVALRDGELRYELGVGEVSEPVAFYNSYYWALVFAKLYRARYGFDAGVEQEVFMLLERAPAIVDWQVVAQVSQVAQET